MLKKVMSVPSFRMFRYNTLKKVFEKLHDIIEKKLMDCKMVADIWTSMTMAGYVAVVALIVNSKLEREVVVLGMEKPEGSHTAANLQKRLNKLKIVTPNLIKIKSKYFYNKNFYSFDQCKFY